MNDRIKRLRRFSFFEAEPSLSSNGRLSKPVSTRRITGKYPVPIPESIELSLEICKQKKTIYIGKDELIVGGERGPAPKAVPTFPELTCHSVEDLHVLKYP